MILTMRKEAALPVRLESETKIRLQMTAAAFGLSPSALIRILISSFVDEFERGGGRILFPPQWAKVPLVAERHSEYSATNPHAPAQAKSVKSSGKRSTNRSPQS